MSANTYKLTYMNLRARGEAARFLFKLADQPFEDKRIEEKDWSDVKPTIPMGQVPILEVNGVIIFQSLAINRYLAKQFGYYGDDALQQAQVDMVVDFIYEPVHQLGIVWHAPKGQQKIAAGKKFNQEHVIPGFTRVQELLEKNHGGDGYLVGNKLSLADISLATMGDVCEHFSKGEKVWSKFPKLLALKKKVEAEPKIAAWIKVRPQTRF